MEFAGYNNINVHCGTTMARVLVTGATGFIGRHLVADLHVGKSQARLGLRLPDRPRRRFSQDGELVQRERMALIDRRLWILDCRLKSAISNLKSTIPDNPR